MSTIIHELYLVAQLFPVMGTLAAVYCPCCLMWCRHREECRALRCGGNARPLGSLLPFAETLLIAPAWIILSREINCGEAEDANC